MIYISDETIDNLIKEDVPYLDLTTNVLGIEKEKGRISFTVRENAILAGTEEVERIFQRLHLQSIKSLPTGTEVKKGETFLEAEGEAGNLHIAWKVSLNILEYCCGIASRTRRLVEKAKSINPELSIVTTRKIFPGTKELSIKAILAGGAYPHRLGLSETILIFEQHINFLGGIDNLSRMINQIRKKACEKKVIVEVTKLEEAEKLTVSGVDGLQFDKVSPAELKLMTKAVRKINPNIALIGAGGINESNIEDYAATGIDAVATTAVYFGKPVDIGAKIVKLF